MCYTFPLVSIADGCKVKHTKGNGLTADNSQPAKFDTKHVSYFTGTDNPRQLRVITALMARPRRREDVDDIAGCANGPDLILDLRCRNLEVPCKRIAFIDRDGCTCRPGVYSFTLSDRRKIYTWLAKCRKGPSGKRS